MDLSIIILNWNAAEDTLRCLRHIAGWRKLRPLLVVVDNASTDDSLERFGREFPDLHIVANKTNLGFAGGNNRGIAYALSQGDQPVLLLNNDAILEEADVARLLETLNADETAGFAGPLLYDADQPDRLLSAGARDPSRHHISHILYLAQDEPVRQVECVPGTAILIKSEVFQKVGLLDEDYFFSSEVADLCLAGARAGYRSLIDTRASCFHGLDRSSEFRGTLYTYYIIRNRFLLVRKFHARWKPAYDLFWTLYSLALAIKVQLAGRPDTARAINLGWQDGLAGRFGNQNERILSLVREA